MDLADHRPPILGFCAYSGTGKTSLLTGLLPILAARGLRIGLIKHAHHTFDIDHPDKDSYKLRKAGATEMLIASRRRWALIHETPDKAQEPEVTELLSRLDKTALDLILIEGFKYGPFPKIELHRPSLDKPLICRQDAHVIAVATDAPAALNIDRPILDLNQPQAIAAFIEAYITSRRAG